MEEHLSTKKVMWREEDVLEYLSSIPQKTSGDAITIICAGHFMLALSADKEHLVPALFQSPAEFAQPALRQYSGLFPEYTWELGCRLTSLLKERHKKALLSLLVNDWQMVPIDSTRQASAPNKYRDDFYKGFHQLPASYATIADSYHITIAEDLYKIPNGDFFLREVRLKDRFLRKLKSLLKQDVCVSIGSCSIASGIDGSINYQQEGGSHVQLANRQGTGCAGGITQMLLDIANDLYPQSGYLNFVNFMPQSCTNPVNTATTVAMDWLAELPLKINVHNLFFEGTGTRQISDFFSPSSGGVTAYEFKNHDNE